VTRPLPGNIQRSLSTGYFPDNWKRAKLVLNHKGPEKPLNMPTSYRTISLLDGAGKILERLLLKRLKIYIKTARAVSDYQFGFRRSRSTIEAIDAVLQIARSAGIGAVQHRRLCTVISLDVKNAFNSVPWELIDAAIQKSVVPTYLVRIIRSYLINR